MKDSKIQEKPWLELGITEAEWLDDGGCSWCGGRCAEADLPQGCWDSPARLEYDGE